MAKTNVKPVPEGYHTINPTLCCRDAARAIDFYKKAFAAEERMRMPGPGGKIMHAELRIGDSIVMLSDEMPDWEWSSPQKYGGTPVSFYCYVNDVDAAWKRATEAGAKVKMPLTDMFWGDRTGKLEDPFGHTWSLASQKEVLTSEEIAKRQKAWMAEMAKGGRPS